MRQFTNYDLTEHNTFGIKAKADLIQFLENENQLPELFNLIQRKGENPRIVGGGSNILFTSPQHPWIVINALVGHQILEEDETHVKVQVAAGENWHDWVLYTLANGWYGLENLSLIPGKVGAAPIQNIGAYGVEIKEHLIEVQGYFLATGAPFTLTQAECQLGYRDSIFKRELKDQVLITSIVLKLSKVPQLKMDYGDIRTILSREGIANPTPEDISNAVIEIRSSKLPNPKDLGNGGSFFKNPVISEEAFQVFNQQFPKAPNYPAPQGVKIPAGWLIEQAGWKGHKRNSCGVHEKQALVLVNHKNAVGSEIASLAHEIIADVQAKFGITLEPEVNFW